MVKRKASTNGTTVTDHQSKKVKKISESNNNTEDVYGKIDTSKPVSTLNTLLGTDNADDFFHTYWEKKHMFVQRNNQKYYGSIFSLDAMKEIIEKKELQFEADLNVCRYVDGEKELLNEKGCEYANNENGEITNDAFQKLMKEDKATFQFHQPQRFSDPLWNIMEKLETQFGSLHGCNVYLTPASAQGLAPHCDDVEIIVLQLEGKKTWKLYKPMVELSRDYTQDLNEEDIGEPFFEQTLEPGDLLYFPRGTIHQAKTTDEGHSLHLSISTYQMNTWGDMMNHAVSQAIENALEDDVEIRTGLPINFLSFLGTSKDIGKYIEVDDKEGSDKKQFKSNEKDSRVIEFKENIKAKLSKLIDHIDVNTAADAMSLDFMNNRLPPFGHQVAEDEENDRKVPSLDDKVRIKYREHVRVMYSDGDEAEEDDDLSQLEDDDDSEMEEEDEKPAKTEKKAGKKTPKKDKKESLKSDTENEDDEDDDDASPGDEEPCIKIVHSLNNPREGHMIGKILGDSCTLKLPVHYGAAAIALLESEKFIKVKDLALEEDDDKLHLATTLFADDLIEFEETA